jgi:DNA-binding beta-propeller fold protein YncE
VDESSAFAKTNAVVDTNAVVIPSGKRVRRASNRLSVSGFPMAMLRIENTPYVVVSDGGIDDEHLRVIDTSGPSPRTVAGGDITFARNGSARQPALFYGLAYEPTSRTIYVSGGGSNYILAYTVSAAGALTADPMRTIDLGLTESSGEGRGMNGELQAMYPAGIALSDDGGTLYAALQRGHELAVISTATRAIVRTIPFAMIGSTAAMPYVVARRPGDAQHVYVGLWGQAAVAEVNVQTNTLTRRFDVGKSPSKIQFSRDGTTMTVVAADSDVLSTVNVSMLNPPVDRHYLNGGLNALRGVSPSSFDVAQDGRIYLTLADENAIDVLDPNTFASLGRITTEWYPTDVMVLDDGRVFVSTGKGIGSGPNNGREDITMLQQGSLAIYPTPTMASLANGAMQSQMDNNIRTGFARVECPNGASNDFPVPPVGSRAGSPQIRHVVMIVRENKTYDALLGDYPGRTNAADGESSLTIVPRAQMPTVFPNLRALFSRFANHDNYYSNAEQSIQGHVWTTQGRTTDFVERTWLSTWGRGTRGIPQQAITIAGTAEEGTLFTALARANVSAEVWGELVGRAEPSQVVGTRYPGIGFNYSPDIIKAFAFTDGIIGTNRNRMNPTRGCTLPRFSYLVLNNDHTEGGRAGRPTPISHFEDNDEATGFIIDALSHSPYWPYTLVIVVEDDPQDGGDHVDNHRSIALLASPWVKSGYTSHVHLDESSLHHTIELILGMPPHNLAVASAAPFYDSFTNTPDFTPYSYIPRRECEQRNPVNGPYAGPSSQMDWSLPDNQPGLSRMLWQMLHGTVAPWTDRHEQDDDD